MSTNPYKLLRELLPEPPLQIGTVQGVNNGVCWIELPGGGIAQARGSASVGAQVYFRDQLIEGIAPSLSIEIIEV
jgi:hypothetical protein